MTGYLLCGWHIQSAIPLPELPLWPDDGHAYSDIEIVSESVDILPTDAVPAPVHVRADGAVLLAVPDIGRFLVHSGRKISVDSSLPRDDAGLRLYLFGSVLAIVCYQRGVVPFHASCLIPNPDVAMRAVMVSGDSGAGKSTLAATFALRGAPILADDLCVIDTSSRCEALVIPSIARLKLWEDTLQRLDIPRDSLERVRGGFDKYSWYGAPSALPTPLAAIYHLTRVTGTAGVAPCPVAGLAAVELLSQCVYRPAIGVALGQESLIAKTLMAVLATTPVFRVERASEVEAYSPLPDMLLDHWRTLVHVDQPVLQKRG